MSVYLTRRRALALAAAFAAAPASSVRAQQSWPQRPLRILVGTTPGGSPDIISRLIADKMTGPLGQSITVVPLPAVAGVNEVMVGANAPFIK